jgi:hypothetical protein
VSECRSCAAGPDDSLAPASSAVCVCSSASSHGTSWRARVGEWASLDTSSLNKGNTCWAGSRSNVRGITPLRPRHWRGSTRAAQRHSCAAPAKEPSGPKRAGHRSCRGRGQRRRHHRCREGRFVATARVGLGFDLGLGSRVARHTPVSSRLTLLAEDDEDDEEDEETAGFLATGMGCAKGCASSACVSDRPRLSVCAAGAGLCARKTAVS